MRYCRRQKSSMGSPIHPSGAIHNFYIGFDSKNIEHCTSWLQDRFFTMNAQTFVLRDIGYRLKHRKPYLAVIVVGFRLDSQVGVEFMAACLYNSTLEAHVSSVFSRSNDRIFFYEL